MITTLTLNAALDKTYYLQTLSIGQTNRLRDVHIEPGGKGINVAKVLHSLGLEVTAGGFIGGNNGKVISALLQDRGVGHEFIGIQGESRTCLTIIDNEREEETEILESGPNISSEDWEKICHFTDAAAKKSTIMTLSGSLPQGVPADGYGQLIDIIKQNGSKAILDSSGAALRYGLEKAPFAVKPNERELKQWLNKETLSLSEALEAGKMFIQKGIQYVCLSLGKEGALFFTRDEVFHVKAPVVNAVNTIGCGDAMVAGLAAGFYQNLPARDVILLAAACGSANAMMPQAGQVALTDLEELRKQVVVKKIDNILS
ncbi:1-phosphofructokinase/tagatose 6-phosphate kinase [Scopulibacillus darangshiensis]|uniref:Tagatose-6-phosphate kinase n=1 Tax=Scopulibacillus darangshiensis TaxID=442528 RepID=A0A4R2NL42_9BACL|nr:1-phosphofructokinase [Scopulibacillus darangshiensis]TCP22333.1 1-phosphofructokinase/tagatose 6-phosphate kinase [Scopulibacillus darangshiensis]